MFSHSNVDLNRLDEATRLLDKYSDRIPIIIHKVYGISEPLKKKFLVPIDLTVGQFMYVIRKQIKLEPSKALFCFTINNIMLRQSMLISELFEIYSSNDKFTYLILSSENTFGC